MIGNVNGIVDSMFAADNLKNRQNAADAKAGSSFSDYLNYALLNARSGSLFGDGIGMGSNYPYMNAMSGSIWQTFALKALIDGMQKNSQTTASESAQGQQENGGASAKAAEAKPDWAKIRVIRHYQSPIPNQNPANRGVLV